MPHIRSVKAAYNVKHQFQPFLGFDVTQIAQWAPLVAPAKHLLVAESSGV
jgi:hypothetical protein